jgi:hypothetical protein
MRWFYFAIIYPYLSYGITIWGSAYKKQLNKLIVIQKRAVRIIAGNKYNEHTNPIFREFHILKLNDIYRVEVSKTAFKFKNKTLPQSIMDLFITNSEIHDRITRQNNDLHVKKCRTTIATQHISSSGPQLWNLLPSKIN